MLVVDDLDCDGVLNGNDEDADGDNFGDAQSSVMTCDQPSGFVTDSTDCDDNNDTVYPNAPEICDGVFQDCSDPEILSESYH